MQTGGMTTRTSASALEQCSRLEMFRHALEDDSDCYMLRVRLESVPANTMAGGNAVVLAKSGPAAPATPVASLPTVGNPCLSVIGGRLRGAIPLAPHGNR